MEIQVFELWSLLRIETFTWTVHELISNIAMRLDSSEGLKLAVKKKLGVGILYQDVVQEEVKRGDFKLIKIPGLKMDGTLFIIYSPKKPLRSEAMVAMRFYRARSFQATLARTPK